MTPWQVFSDFAANKITADLHACAPRLRWSWNEFGLTSHSAFFERGHFIICNIELEVDLTQEGYALMADVKKFSKRH